MDVTRILTLFVLFVISYPFPCLMYLIRPIFKQYSRLANTHRDGGCNRQFACFLLPTPPITKWLVQ